jgi:hypothetical protein
MNTNGPALIVPPAPPAAEAAQSLRGAHPPVVIQDYWMWLWIALAALAAGAVLFYLWKRWRRAVESRPAEPVVPPHVRARRRLEQALRLIDDPKPFTIAVSDATRQYLEERFQFKAPERTTEEFLYELQASNLLTPDQKQSLGEFLQQCDMVKFARYEPLREELQSMHDSALRLVDETEPGPAQEQGQAPPPAAP